MDKNIRKKELLLTNSSNNLPRTGFIRLSKFLSQAGVSSRRKSDDIIRSGQVKVNNIIVLEPYYQVRPEIDLVTIGNNSIFLATKRYYFALNKPKNYLSDLNFADDRNLARKLIPIDAYIFPVGRLDYDSEGLMLFTNDGELANKIMHPRYGVEKEYVVKFKGTLTRSDLESVKKGLTIDGSVSPVLSISKAGLSDDNSWYSIILQEGKNRIIRKIGDALGHPVLRLKRVRIGHIKLGGLRPGTFREVSELEIQPFKSIPNYVYHKDL
jgi:23S rRNA pseudouridine2605 synthase